MNGSIRLAVRLALFVALASLALGLAASPSHADDSAERDRAALQLSLDGVTWTESIRQPLFDPDTRCVPGDTRTARFFVPATAGAMICFATSREPQKGHSTSPRAA